MWAKPRNFFRFILLGLLLVTTAVAQELTDSDEDGSPPVKIGAAPISPVPATKLVRRDAGFFGNLVDSLIDSPFFGPITAWSGSLGLERGGYGGGSDSRFERESLSLNASTYFFQPWFSTANGALWLNRSTVNDAGPAYSVTGFGTVNILSRSRFPFSAALGVGEFSSQGVGADDTRSETLGLRQGFQSLDTKTNAEVRYDTGKLSRTNGANSSFQAFQGNQSTRTEGGGYGLSGGLREASDSTGGSSLSSNLAASRHGTNEDYGLIYSTSVSNNHNETRLAEAQSGVSKFGSDVWFALGNASWYPSDETDDWTMSAFGNLSHSQLSALEKTAISAATLGLNTNYRFTPKVSGSAGASIGAVQQSKDGSARSNYSVNGQLSYYGDASKIHDWDHLWNTTGGLSVFGSSGRGAQGSANGAIGHSFGKLISRPQAGENIDLRYSQDLSVSQSDVGTAGGFRHQLSAGWRLPNSLSSSLSLSDSYSFGVTSSNFQSLVATVNGGFPLGAAKSFSANANFMLNRDAETGKQTDLLSGSASYSDIRFMGVANLRYNAGLSAQTQIDRVQQAGEAETSFIGWRLDQSLTQRVGLLSLEGRFDYAQPMIGPATWQFLIRLTRDFRS